MSVAYPSLFTPLDLHGVTLRNRIVHASMTTKMGAGQRVTDALLNYHRSRALGGAGAIVTEPLAVQPWHKEGYKVGVLGNTALDGLARWADAVEGQDCRLLAQLQDSGRGRHETGKHPFAIGPSALPDDLSWVVPRAMSHSEIEQLIERFVQAAAQLQLAGFSGVEISAAHGHLFHQFLSPWSNLRTDDWGGPLENRTRLVRSLVAQIRDRCGASFIIGVKLPGDDGLVQSIDLEEAANITQALAAPELVSYICHAQGSHSLWLDMHLPDMHGPRVPFLELVRGLRKSAGRVPLLAVGLITDPAEAERLVASGDSELVGLGRPLVTDPAWPDKARDGRAADIRYCVSCNTCWATIIRDGQPIACDNNPRVGKHDEADWWPERVRRKKRVVVVGGGVAGMETAWIAAARGHEVTVLSRTEQVGGKTWLQAQLPGGENLSSVYDYQLQAAQRAGLKVQACGMASVERIVEVAPDSVVLATGSSMLWPRELPRQLEIDGYIQNLREVMIATLHLHSSQGGTALIYDQDHTVGTYMAVERLCKIFDRVVLCTPRDSVAQQEALVTRQGVYRRLNMLGVELIPFSEFGDMSNLEEGVAMVRNVYTRQESAIEDIALLTYATPRQPNDCLLEPLQNHGFKVELVGDCRMPGTLLEATSAGHALGNEL